MRSPNEPRPIPALRRLAAVDHLVRQVALWAGGLALLGLMGLTVLDVVLRYVFNTPIFGARDVAKLILLVMVAASVAYSARTGGQVAIDLFSSRMGPRLARRTEIGVRAAALGMLLVLAWRLWCAGLSAGRFGEASLALFLPFKPFYVVLALGMLLYAVVLAAEIPVLWRGHPVESNGQAD